MQTYNDLGEEKTFYLRKAGEILENREEVRKISVGDKSLVDLIKAGIEESVSLLENGFITRAKEEHWKFLVMLSNVARVDVSFAECIKGDVEKSISRIYPKYTAALHSLSPNDYEAAILVATDESKELIERYWLNPAKDASREIYNDVKASQPVEETKSFWQKLKQALRRSNEEDDN